MAAQGQEEALDSTSAQTANGDTASAPAYPQIGFSISRYVHHVVKATLYSTKANFLLVFIPLSIVGAAHEWNPALIFGLSFFAMFPLAELLSWSTEQLSASTGQVIGGLLMAAFGNAVEMIVGITALKQQEFRIVQSSMVGSILSGTLLILGSCLFVAGSKEKEVKFNLDLTGIMSSLMIVASASLVIPSASYFADQRSTILNIKLGHEGPYILTLSHIAAIILLLFYCLYLFFQLKTHAEIFAAGSDDEPEGPPELDPWAAGIVLILSTVGVSVCSDSLIDSVDGSVQQLGVSRAFIGLILVPIVGNAGEFVAAVNQAKKKNIDFALGLIVGSTLQIALFVTPFLVMMGWIIGKPMSLRFDTFQTVVLAMSVIVVSCLARDGRSNWFEGFLLLGTYFIIAIAFFVHPDIVETASS
ncbi:Calcium/proton exchanger [Hyaloscypha variabilis F]|uniref:Vacuolar calcium ion transporter n=1 Tax=Hyaloscypha variabilis (strain UAMH 11265 / GT02V1 / F) TaxID=1149755 RepID=A0A2J6R4K5_HYAVF|nr:Calcium/proton exchanger [Hyaloscypha variabilis F]